jgi:hypothetical protein
MVVTGTAEIAKMGPVQIRQGWRASNWTTYISRLKVETATPATANTVRITCALPLNNEQQAAAVQSFLEYLKADGRDDLGIDGFTISDPHWPAWIGQWYSDKLKTWVDDRIVVCFIDLRPLGGGVDPFQLVKLRGAIENIYRERAGAEEQIWITGHCIVRHRRMPIPRQRCPEHLRMVNALNTGGS